MRAPGPGRFVGDRLRRHSTGLLERLSVDHVAPADRETGDSGDERHPAPGQRTGRCTSPGNGSGRTDRAVHGARRKRSVGVTIPRVVAHRGSSARHRDNSWPAFAAAVAEGADAIECDVIRTLDGVLVVRHDLALAERPVAEITAAELASIEPGAIRLVDLVAWAERS